MKRLIVVAPTFNEAENVQEFVTAIFSKSKTISDVQTSLLISDSHSLDGTKEAVLKLQQKYPNLFYHDVLKRGLGLGLISGLNYAVNKLHADFLVTIEADLSNDIQKLPDIVKKLDKFDVVFGSRYAPGGKIKNWSWWRRAISYWANRILRLLSWSDLHEFTNLYRGFKSDAWKQLEPKLKTHHGWLFVPAFAFEAINSRFSWVEIPYTFFDRFSGNSKMNTISYSFDLLLYAVHYRLNRLFK